MPENEPDLVTITMDRKTAQMLHRFLNEVGVDPEERISSLSDAFYAISEALEKPIK